jgi:pyrroline-5-carboxylate reductase
MARSLTDGTPLGVIGVGHLARFLVSGLRRSGDARPIILSPRNAVTSADLAATFGCHVRTDNQAVVDEAGIVLFATPPKACLEAIAALRWRPDQLLLSMVAGVDLAALQAAAPGARVVRAIPAPSAEAGADIIPICPEDCDVQRILAPLGEILQVTDEPTFQAIAAAGLCQVWAYGLIDAIALEIGAAGVPAELALRVAAGHLRAAAAFADFTRDKGGPRARLDAEARPGTLTGAGLATLEGAGAFEAWRRAYAAGLIRSRGHSSHAP